MLFYRPFSNAPQPCGRYWLDGESPFHKIDISFETLRDFDDALRKQEHAGHPAVVRGISVRPHRQRLARHAATMRSLQFDELELDIGWRIYMLQSVLKSHLRGDEPFSEVTSDCDALRATLRGAGRNAVVEGGRIGCLAWRLVDMVDHLRNRPYHL